MWLPHAAIFLLACAVFTPAARIGFRLDDGLQVLSNAAVRDFDLGAIVGGGYWANVRQAGVSYDPGSDLYRPLTTLSVAISFALWGEDPVGYHCENIALHACAAVLVWMLMLVWRIARAPALWIAVLFAIAPIHVEAIGSVVLRNELLAAIFGLLFLRDFALGRTVRGSIWLMLALLAKESAIALPFSAVLADRVFATVRGSRARFWLRRYLPVACAVTIYLAARAAVLGRLTLAPEAAYFGPAVTWPEVWATMATFALEYYVCGALFGAPLVADFTPQSYPTASLADPPAIAALAFWAVVIAASVWAAWRRRNRIAAGVVLFLLWLAPTSNVLTRIGVLGAGRLVYLPQLGLAIAVVLALHRVWQRCARWRVALACAAVAAAAALVVRTERHLAVWQDELRFYDDLVQHVPHNALALGLLGEAEFGLALGARATGAQAVAVAGEPVSVAACFARAFEHLGRSIEVEPKHWLRLSRSWVRSAVELGREDELLLRLARAIAPEGRIAPPAWSEPPDAGELAAWQGVGAVLQRARPQPGEWQPLDAAARDAEIGTIGAALTPRQQAWVGAHIGDPRFARELAAVLGAIAPDLLFARAVLGAAPADASVARSLSPSARQAWRAALDAARAALARVRQRCQELQQPNAGGSPARAVGARLATELFGRDFLRQCDALLPRLVALRSAL